MYVVVESVTFFLVARISIRKQSWTPVDAAREACDTTRHGRQSTCSPETTAARLCSAAWPHRPATGTVDSASRFATASTSRRRRRRLPCVSSSWSTAVATPTTIPADCRRRRLPERPPATTRIPSSSISSTTISSISSSSSSNSSRCRTLSLLLDFYGSSEGRLRRRRRPLRDSSTSSLTRRRQLPATFSDVGATWALSTTCRRRRATPTASEWRTRDRTEMTKRGASCWLCSAPPARPRSGAWCAGRIWPCTTSTLWSMVGVTIIIIVVVVVVVVETFLAIRKLRGAWFCV